MILVLSGRYIDVKTAQYLGIIINQPHYQSHLSSSPMHKVGLFNWLTQQWWHIHYNWEHGLILGLMISKLGHTEHG